MQDEHTITARTIIALERAAPDRWGAGDPDDYNDLAPPTSPTSTLRSRTLYRRSSRIAVLVRRDGMVNTKVQLIGSDAAALGAMELHTPWSLPNPDLSQATSSKPAVAEYNRRRSPSLPLPFNASI